MLDSAGYGAVTISQSLTITNPGGVEAGVSPSGTTAAITIDASVNTTVVLRGLTIEGNGVGTNGILVNPTLPDGGSIATVDILDCVIKDFTQNGIDIAPSGFAVENLVIDHTRSLNNTGSGIEIAAVSSPVVQATINSATMDDNGTGITLGGSGGRPTLILESHADYNNSTGISLNANNTMIMKSSTAIGNNQFLGYDVANVGGVELDNNNTISSIDDTGSGGGTTDGSNNIGSIAGNSGALIKQPQQ